MPCEIMTADQVAELLQVSRELIYQLATRGKLPGRKVGRKCDQEGRKRFRFAQRRKIVRIWRLPRSAVEDFIQERRSVSTGSSADEGGS